MKVVTLIGIGVFVVVFVPLLYFQFQTGEKTDMRMASKSIEADIKALRELNDHANSWVHEHNDAIHTMTINEEWEEKQHDPVYVVDYFFATAMLKDPNLFVQAVKANQLSHDLFSVDEPNKMLVVDEMMNRITRGEKLEYVEHIRVDTALNQQSADSSIRLYYSDGMSVKKNILLESEGTHHEGNDGVFFVSTSIWEIIHAIEEDSKPEL